jgi:hypothetical protein
MREYVFHHCSWWKCQQTVLRKAVGKATGWTACRCQHVQISKLFYMEKYNQVRMDILVATDIGKFPAEHRQKCKSTIDCALAQLITSLRWTPAQCAAYSHL